MVENINHTDYLSINDFLVVEQKGDLKKIDISILNSLKSKNIELQRGATSIQWRLEGESVWNNLISLNDLVGAKGRDAKDLELRNSNGVIQWRNTGDNWKDLVTVESLMPRMFSDGKKIPDLESTEHINPEDYVILEQADGTKKVELSILNSTENIMHKNDESITTVKDNLDRLDANFIAVNLELDEVKEGVSSNASAIAYETYNRNSAVKSLEERLIKQQHYVSDVPPQDTDVTWFDITANSIDEKLDSVIIEELKNVIAAMSDRIIELQKKVEYLWNIQGSEGNLPEGIVVGDYLLLEEGGVILLEDGNKILLEKEEI